MKLLLLNPPSLKPVFRDCYCSGSSKGTIFIHPFDLQIQSGFFPPNEFQLEFIDAVFERLSAESALSRIRTFSPDVILSLVGEASSEEDAAFLKKIKTALPSVRLFLSGDMARFKPGELFVRIPEAEGLLTDFGSSGLLEHLRGEKSPFLLLRHNDSSSQDATLKKFEYHLPWEGFVRKYSYRLPFFHEPSFYSIGFGFGCPYECLYCNTHLLGYRSREVKPFIEELQFASRLGYKSLYIRDATFMVNKNQTLHLFNEWEKIGGFQWMCFTRPDVLDEEIVARASQLGCCLMMLGVESYDDAWLTKMSRKTADISVFPVRENHRQESVAFSNGVKKTFQLLRKYRIRSAAQVMVGMRQVDESYSDSRENLSDYEQNLKRFIKNLDPDYVSLNVFFRRPGIEAKETSFAIVESNKIEYEKLSSRVNRWFYFQPKTIVRQLPLLANWKQVGMMLKSAVNLIRY